MGPHVCVNKFHRDDMYTSGHNYKRCTSTGSDTLTGIIEKLPFSTWGYIRQKCLMNICLATFSDGALPVISVFVVPKS